jgi:hypothetical protein
MNLELKKAIFLYMIEKHKYSQLVNHTIEEFRQYIYLPNGEHCIGGEAVSDFITAIDKLI